MKDFVKWKYISGLKARQDNLMEELRQVEAMISALRGLEQEEENQKNSNKQKDKK